jgi:hypothetical protein
VLSGAVQLCVRPESIEVMQGGAQAAGTMPGHIVDVVPLGPVRQLLIELAGGDRVLAAQPNRADSSPVRGEAVAIAVPPTACTLFPASA